MYKAFTPLTVFACVAIIMLPLLFGGCVFTSKNDEVIAESSRVLKPTEIDVLTGKIKTIHNTDPLGLALEDSPAIVQVRPDTVVVRGDEILDISALRVGQSIIITLDPEINGIFAAKIEICSSTEDND